MKKLIIPLVLFLFVLNSYGQDSPKNYVPEDFSGKIWHETDGYVIVEAESLPLSSIWSHRADAGDPYSDGSDKINDPEPENYTGTGYMRFDGPHNGHGHEEDLEHIYQGSHKDWLVVKIWCENPGAYRFDMRVYHLKLDGDNDIWAGYIGQISAIRRMADRVVKGYTWSDWDNAIHVNLKAGLNAVYLAGRSKGLGIDRVAIFQESKASIARNPATAESSEWTNATHVKLTNPKDGDSYALNETIKLEASPPAADAAKKQIPISYTRAGKSADSRRHVRHSAQPSGETW